MNKTLLLDVKHIKQGIRHPEVDLHVLQTVDSTQSWLKAIKHPHGIVCCLAEHQTAGRGRFGRPWVAPFGENIYLSCLYPLRKDISALSGLSIVISLAVIRTLQDYGLKVVVKWPNDIYYDEKKLSGCLVEVQGRNEVVIGIGLNVNSLDSDISQPWTSLRKISLLSARQDSASDAFAQADNDLHRDENHCFDRNPLTAQLINHLLDYLQRFEAQGLTAFMNEWRASDYLLGKTISLNQANTQITGKVMGINEGGQLLLQCEDGVLRSFSSGETSTRGMG